MRVETWVVGFLAAFTAASPFATAPSVALEERQIGPVSTQQLGQFKIYAEYAAATYCNGQNSPGQVISCSGDACNQVTANRPTTVASFSGPLTGIQGFVATDPVRREIILAIRGSVNVRNWITNFRLLSTPCNFVSFCRVHSGFNSAWNEIRNQAQAAVAQARAVNPSYRVVVTGHSLGGAVATIAGASLRASGTPAELYTYASPRVGNERFASFVSNQLGGHYRVTHGADPVPKLPPFAVGYRHTTPEYWLNGGSSTTINYSPANIKVCTGTLTFGCNNGFDIPDPRSHLYYLNNMSGCSNGGFELRLPGEEDGEFEEALDRMLEMDREYIEKNETPKNATMTV